MTMDEHEDCDRQLCEAEDKIKDLEAQLANKTSVAAKAYTACGNYQQQIGELKAENKQLRSIKCPPISDGDTCICPIEELEAKLEQHRWIPVSEIPKNDSYHIATNGSKCEWLYFNETWFYAKNKKPYPRFFMIKFYWPISLPEQPLIGS